MPWGDAVRCRDRCRVALGRFVFRRAITAGCAPSRAGRCPGAIFPVRSSVVRRRFCPDGRLEEGLRRGTNRGCFVRDREIVRATSEHRRTENGRRGGGFPLGWRIFLPGPDDRGAGRRVTAGAARFRAGASGIVSGREIVRKGGRDGVRQPGKPSALPRADRAGRAFPVERVPETKAS